MTDHYAVIGNPIAHSKSPRIHAAFASQTDQKLHYDKLLVEQGCLAQAINKFRSQNGKGLNITVPFKNDAFDLADSLTERAQLAGAVNTLVLNDDGTLHADNTDGIGLVRDLTHNHGFNLKGARILLLGAGGAVQGVLLPLLQQQPAEIVIANRTVSKAEALCEKFSSHGNLSASSFEALDGKLFDGIINGTAASLQGEVPPLPDNILNKEAWCYDMMYSSEPTAFVRWGKEHGAAHSVDGLGMLVEQAAESFTLWRNVRPETAPVINLLRED
ncbi:MAG: shikimate dehydrogenase [Sulfuriflexus sp.]|nr:shikimate dehydrogenase [Sulfuriflexus sp.]